MHWRQLVGGDSPPMYFPWHRKSISMVQLSPAHFTCNTIVLANLHVGELHAMVSWIELDSGEVPVIVNSMLILVALSSKKRWSEQANQMAMDVAPKWPNKVYTTCMSISFVYWTKLVYKFKNNHNLPNHLSQWPSNRVHVCMLHYYIAYIYGPIDAWVHACIAYIIISVPGHIIPT